VADRQEEDVEGEVVGELNRHPRRKFPLSFLQ
jgi:hypothetical protein